MNNFLLIKVINVCVGFMIFGNKYERRVKSLPVRHLLSECTSTLSLTENATHLFQHLMELVSLRATKVMSIEQNTKVHKSPKLLF